MQSLLQITLILISLQTIFFSISKCQTIEISTAQSDDNYLYTSSVGWGTPTQKFNLMVDTTDHTSWVYNGSVNTDSSTFNSGSSSTYEFESNKQGITYTYQGSTMEDVMFAYDTLTIGDTSLVKQSFGIATNRFNITDDENLSGFLALDRENVIISGLYNNKSIENETVTIDVPNNKVYFGPHTPSPIENYSNATECPVTGNEYLDNDWTFDADIFVDGGIVGTLGKAKAVIDSGSPYLTIYASSLQTFLTFWHAVDGTTTTFNCNYTTRYCDSTDIMTYMTINIGTSPNYIYTINIFKEDILDGKYIQVYYDEDTAFTTCDADVGCDYVVFLGRPFLKHVVVTLDYGADPQTLTFFSLKTTTSSLNWLTIGIVFGSVAAFAILFFGLYYWKYGRIPPPSNHDIEEQSLLRGPVQQAVGTGQGINQGAMYQGMSGIGGGGLDDDDDEFNRQLQEAQRHSQIEDQQQRERQMRQERERREREEMEQQAELQQAQSRNQQQAQSGGGRLGGSAAKPQDKDDLRARRLKFLEDQEKKAQDQGDDQ